MGPSDLDAHSFVPSRHKTMGIKAHCLEGLNDRLLGGVPVSRLKPVRVLALIQGRWSLRPFFLRQVLLNQRGAFTPLNGSNLPFDVLDEELVAVPLGQRKRTLEAFEFRLLLVIHAMEHQLAHTLAGLDQ